MLLGLPYRTRLGGDFAIGRTIPYVFQNAPCRVVVVREAVDEAGRAATDPGRIEIEMRTIIVGCGRVGAGLAGRLAAAGDEVTVIDLRTDSFDKLPEGFGGNAVRGDGTDEDVLRRLGVDGADRFFALTEGDNRNILAAQLAAETFSVPRSWPRSTTRSGPAPTRPWASPRSAARA